MEHKMYSSINTGTRWSLKCTRVMCRARWSVKHTCSKRSEREHKMHSRGKRESSFVNPPNEYDVAFANIEVIRESFRVMSLIF